MAIFSISPKSPEESRPPPGWESSPDFAYVGRKGKGLDGRFGNPFPLNFESERDLILQQYEDYLLQRLHFDEDFRASVRALHGKHLVCFCVPLKCHAEILQRYAALLASMSDEEAVKLIGERLKSLPWP
jgi:hypothetical protein